MPTTAIVWFRNDLRLADNPALAAACTSAERILPVFIWHPAEHGAWAPGPASRAWLVRSPAEWVAGSGADAAPYFRIFNPGSRAVRYDPDKAYVQQWVPELDTAAYPPPMIDHAEARIRALAAYEAVKAAR